MTYGVGLLLNDGMVLLSDTRTNAGIDHISSYRKMFRFEVPGERVVMILTAGSLSTTQATIARLQEAVEDPGATPDSSILLAPSLLKVAEMIGATLWSVRAAMDQRMNSGGQYSSSNCSEIVASTGFSVTMQLCVTAASR